MLTSGMPRRQSSGSDRPGRVQRRHTHRPLGKLARIEPLVTGTSIAAARWGRTDGRATRGASAGAELDRRLAREDEAEHPCSDWTARAAGVDGAGEVPGDEKKGDARGPGGGDRASLRDARSRAR